MPRLMQRLSIKTDLDDGSTAVEYGLLLGVIAVLLIISVGQVGANLNTIYERVAALF